LATPALPADNKGNPKVQVKDLIEQLSQMDPEMEVFLPVPGGMKVSAYASTRLKIEQGYTVHDETGFYAKSRGNGVFFDEAFSNRIMDDGKKFLDLTSSTIHRSVQISLHRY
jgi:hypothetical protein